MGYCIRSFSLAFIFLLVLNIRHGVNCFRSYSLPISFINRHPSLKFQSKLISMGTKPASLGADFCNVSSKWTIAHPLVTIHRHEKSKKLLHIEVYEQHKWLPLKMVLFIPYCIRKLLFSTLLKGKLSKLFLPIAKCGIRDFVAPPTSSMIDYIAENFPREQDINFNGDMVAFMIYMYGKFGSSLPSAVECERIRIYTYIFNQSSIMSYHYVILKPPPPPPNLCTTFNDFII